MTSPKNVIGGGAIVGLMMAGILTPAISGSTKQVIFSGSGNFIGFAATIIALQFRKG